MDKSDFISRIAPTPSGYLHVGNGVNFLLTWLVTRLNDGILHLRIDDIDTQRVQTRYIDNVFETLEFLKIDWDRGAKNTEDYLLNYQFKYYAAFFQEKFNTVFKSTPSLYPCKCSRKQICKISNSGLYPKTCFHKKVNYDMKTCSIRLHVPIDTFINIGDKNIKLEEVFGDFIVWRKGGFPAYQFASLVQDEIFGTTHIVRGNDLFYSSAAQIYMAKLFSFSNFQKVHFWHHQLICDDKNIKLSKSKNAKAILGLGCPQTIYKEVAFLLGLESGSEDSLESLLEACRVKFKQKSFDSCMQ